MSYICSPIWRIGNPRPPGKLLCGWNWRGGRVAESTGLLNLHTGNRITSSNLVLSAKHKRRKVSSLLEHLSSFMLCIARRQAGDAKPLAAAQISSERTGLCVGQGDVQSRLRLRKFFYAVSLLISWLIFCHHG